MWECKERLGFEQDPHEKSLWVRGLGTAFIVYIIPFCGDVIVAANCEEAHQQFVGEFEAQWGFCDFKEPSFLLGCDVVQTQNAFRLTAATKIKLILAGNGMLECKPKETPFPQGRNVDVLDCPPPEKKLKLPFRHLLGQLGYIQYSCRPTIAMNISQLARVQNNPGKEHWQLLVHVLK